MLLEFIARSFDLSTVRSRSMLRAAIFHFAFVAGVTGLKSATNALYLARRDPTDMPWLYVGTALFVTLVTVWIGKRLGVVSAKHVLRRTLFVASSILLILAALAALDVRSVFGPLYVAGEASATALSVLFWARLGEVFDVRAGKRVFGAIGAAGMAGAVVGGLVVMGLAAAELPSVVWCFLAPVLFVATMPLLGSARSPGTIRRERTTFVDGMRYAMGRAFPLAVALLVLLFAINHAAVDFVFRTGTHRFEGGDEAQMTSLFGVLNAVVGVMSIAVQGALTARLLRRLGVFFFLSIVPALTFGSALWALLAPASFIPLFAMKAVEMMGSYSLNQTGLQLLYNPMPTAVRGSVRALIDGAVKKLGVALGGAVLLIVGAFISTTGQLVLVVGLGAALIGWIMFMRPMYRDALKLKLGNRGLGPIPVIDPAERATRMYLLSALADGDASRTLSAIEVLSMDSEFDFRSHIEQLIAHPSEVVRMKTVDLLQRAPDDEHVPFLVSVIQSGARTPKAQAARALVMIDPVTARRVLEPVLTAAKDRAALDRGLLSAAIVALLAGERAASDEDAEGGVSSLARDALDEMIANRADRPGGERRRLARMIGQLGPGPYAKHLVAFLDDANPAVRRAALEAAGVALDSSLPEHLVEHLSDRDVQVVARKALVAYGNQIVPLLAQFLDDRRREVSARVQVPSILRMIGTAEAANAMLFSNRHDDAYLRYVIIEELGRMHRRDPALRFNKDQTHGAALRRLRAYTHYRRIAEDLLLAGPEYALLHRAVDDRVRQNLQAGLYLLGLLYDAKAMENAFFGLMSVDGPSRSDGVELVDVALEGSEVRGEVVGYVEQSSPVGSPDEAVSRAVALVEGKDILLAMVAAETLRRIGRRPPEVREPTSGEPLMPKSIVERVFLLQSVQLFRGLSVDDLSAVAGLCTEGHAEPRSVVYEEGDRADAMYVIISGDIHLLAGGEPLMDLHAGDSFGQTSVLDGGARPVTAKAGDEGADFMRLQRQPLQDLMADRPQLVSGLLAELGVRIRELIDRTKFSSGQAK